VQKFTRIAAAFGVREFGFAVTPNVDHLIRYGSDADFREIYDRASFVLLDSRFLARLLKATTRQRLPTCPGSDLTCALFADVISPDDDIVLVGGSNAQADALRTAHGLKRLKHYDPPMGFIDDVVATEKCLRFIEAASPFRFCFLAIGSPQQERMAGLLLQRGHARGLALCVGGAINFMTGVEKRAPQWMQHHGLEWFYRLMRNPRRMAYRYLIRGPRIFFLLPRLKFVLRPATATAFPAPPAVTAAPATSVV
jgi:exopolysaccharide biosynthesis WecB/TagA/CpsF family protein